MLNKIFIKQIKKIGSNVVEKIWTYANFRES